MRPVSSEKALISRPMNFVVMRWVASFLNLDDSARICASSRARAGGRYWDPGSPRSSQAPGPTAHQPGRDWLWSPQRASGEPSDVGNQGSEVRREVAGQQGDLGRGGGCPAHRRDVRFGGVPGGSSGRCCQPLHSVPEAIARTSQAGPRLPGPRKRGFPGLLGRPELPVSRPLQGSCLPSSVCDAGSPFDSRATVRCQPGRALGSRVLHRADPRGRHRDSLPSTAALRSPSGGPNHTGARAM